MRTLVIVLVFGALLSVTAHADFGPPCCVAPPETHNHEQHKKYLVVSAAISLAAVMPKPSAHEPADAWPPILLILTCTVLTIGVIVLRSYATLREGRAKKSMQTSLPANDDIAKRRIA